MVRAIEPQLHHKLQPVSARTAKTKRRSWAQVKDVLEKAFRKEFSEDTVDISHGYGNNIHVVVVSRRFDKMKDRPRQDLMWKIVDSTSLTNEEKQLISLLYPVSPREIK